MIKLEAIASRTMNGSLQAARTMTQVTGVAFVTVENDYTQAVNIRQGFVPFQALVNVVNPSPQPAGTEQSVDASQSVGTEGRLFEPTLPKAGPANLIPSCPSWPRTTPATISPPPRWKCVVSLCGRKPE